MTRSNDSLKVIVVGVPKTMDDSGLHDLFSAYGSVADAKIVKDAATDASRGFGFVTFTAQSAMRRAVKEMDKKQLEGRTLNVRQLVAKDQLQKKDPKSEDMAKRPCYLLRKGKCTKGDRCPYSHDTKSGEFGSCFEFVQNGLCKRGDNCKFFHPPPQTEVNGDGDKENKDDSDREFAPPVMKEAKAADMKETNKQASDEKKTKDNKAKTEKKGEDGKPRYCFAFQSGRCHRGKRCLFLHEKLVVPENEAPPAAEAAIGKKRPGDFEVVTTEEPSKKRQRESDDEDSDEEKSSKPATKTKDNAQQKTTEKAKEKATEKAKEKAKEKTVVSKADTKEKVTKSKTGDEKPAKTDKPAVGADGKPIHTGPKPICRHFLKGLCKRGHICFFRHEQPTDEELKDLLPAIKGSKKKAENDDDDEEDDPTALQAVADHMASFMANISSGKPYEPFVPSAATGMDNTQSEASAKADSPPRPSKRKASEVADEAAAQSAAKRQRPVKKEKVDMGAAFDGVDSDDDDAPTANRHKKLTREEMKASREKLREQRRAKKANKKQARERLKTDGEIELS